MWSDQKCCTWPLKIAAVGTLFIQTVAAQGRAAAAVFELAKSIGGVVSPALDHVCRMAEYLEQQVEDGFLFLGIELERLGTNEDHLVQLGLLERRPAGRQRYAVTDAGAVYMVEGEYATILMRRRQWMALRVLIEAKARG